MQAVHSASFYGASYAIIPSISAEEHFDVGFSFKTAFPQALLMFAGNVSQVFTE